MQLPKKPGSVRDMKQPDLLTTKEVAELFTVSPRTIRRWGTSGILQMIKPAGRLRFPVDQTHIQAALRLRETLREEAASE